MALAGLIGACDGSGGAGDPDPDASLDAGDGGAEDAGDAADAADAETDAPVASPQSVETEEGKPVAITLAGAPGDGGELSFELVDQPQHGALAGDAPHLIYTPDGEFTGEDSFTFRVVEGGLSSPPAAVSITVHLGSSQPGNSPPVADAQNVTTSEDSAVAITLTGSDADGDALTFTVASAPGHGSLSGAPPTLTYTPNAGFSGADSFTFTVSDGEDSSPPATVNILVQADDTPPVNTPPIANPQTVNTTSATSIALTLTGSDADGDPLSFTIAASPSHGSLSGSAPALVYTPDAGYAGTDGFTFTVSDGEASSAPALVTIVVEEVSYAIRGTMSGYYGLSGSNDVGLTNNASDLLFPTTNAFEFPDKIIDGGAYHVAVAQDPWQQLCGVENARGVVSGGDVDDVHVRCRYWNSLTDINEDAESWRDVNPQITLDDQGDAMAVWHHIPAPFSTACRPSMRLYASRYSKAADTWEAPKLVNSHNSSEATAQGRIAMLPKGDAIAIWKRDPEICDTPVVYDLYASRYSRADDSWSAQERLDTLDSSVQLVSLTADQSGGAFAVWSQRGKSGDAVFSRVYQYASDEWLPIEEISAESDTSSKADLSVEASENDHVMAVWSTGFTSISANHYTRSGSYGSWGTPESIAVPSGTVGSANFGMNSSGDAVVAWHRYGAPHEIMTRTYSSMTSAWSDAVLAAHFTPTIGRPVRPNVQVNDEGRAVIIWYADDLDGDRRLWSSRYDPRDDVWTGAEIIDGSIGANTDIAATTPQLVLDDKGNAIVVWQHDNTLWSNRYSAANDAWDSTVYLPPGGGGSGEERQPHMLLHRGGDIYLAYYLHQFDVSWGNVSPGRVMIALYR